MSMAKKLQFGPLPKAESIICLASVKAELDCSDVLHAQTRGEVVEAEKLIPHMLEVFIVGRQGSQQRNGAQVGNED